MKVLREETEYAVMKDNDYLMCYSAYGRDENGYLRVRNPQYTPSFSGGTYFGDRGAVLTDEAWARSLLDGILKYCSDETSTYRIVQIKHTWELQDKSVLEVLM